MLKNRLRLYPILFFWEPPFRNSRPARETLYKCELQWGSGGGNFLCIPLQSPGCPLRLLIKIIPLSMGWSGQLPICFMASSSSKFPGFVLSTIFKLLGSSNYQQQTLARWYLMSISGVFRWCARFRCFFPSGAFSKIFRLLSSFPD